MKKLLFIISVILFIGCKSDINPNLGSVTATYSRGTYNLPIHIIDGCQYISGNYVLEHKGNCNNPIHCYNKID